ncbi:MAG: hypothetical protein JNK30_21105 [Phenylobacterium sp.]|uniref:hypothetical protein n=1 Tax=Phenylobacterium sp. TaxID=1871053 RepID=UPI001A594A88|nr:hypothetical protein [Phenylobacterium sp.]MBL8773899.1 hypothetical protein [Phenylobacterium sp.]
MMSEATEAAAVYKKGLNYIAAGRRIAAVAKRLDNGDARQARNLSDRLMDKGLKILAGVMKPKRASQ